MQIYNGRQEAKMRSEALKPPVQYPNAPGVGSRVPEGYAGGPPVSGVDPSRGVVGGYPEQMANMSAFNPAAAAGMAAAQAQGYNPYGGMDFGGYGAAMQMGAYGMGAYGGYGMGGAAAAQDAMQMRQAQEMPGAYGGGGYGAAAMQQMMQGGYQGQMMGYG
jgi:hypothetical protein